MNVKFAFAALLILAVSCGKKNNPVITNPTQPAKYHPIPHWETDTLIGGIKYIDPVFDTLYSFTQNGKSYIIHHGTQYELKTKEFNYTKYSDSAQSYLTVVFDMAGNQISPNISNISITPAKYWDTVTLKMVNQQQVTMLPFAPFNTIKQPIYFGK